MQHPIGFVTEEPDRSAVPDSVPAAPDSRVRSCLVHVFFPGAGRTLTYYNDRFCLKKGDIVFVDGVMAGRAGEVQKILYNFKIRPENYRRVLSAADTDVHGELLLAGSFCLSFSPSRIPVSRIRSWFLPPQEEFLTGTDNTEFPLLRPPFSLFPDPVRERGRQYCSEGRVVYLSLDGEQGCAIVLGSAPYEVEFTLRDGSVSHMTCTCPCSENCKHQYAVLLQLAQLLDLISGRWGEAYRESRYFAAVEKSALYSYVLSGRDSGSLIL